MLSIFLIIAFLLVLYSLLGACACFVVERIGWADGPVEAIVLGLLWPLTLFVFVPFAVCLSLLDSVFNGDSSGEKK